MVNGHLPSPAPHLHPKLNIPVIASDFLYSLRFFSRTRTEKAISMGMEKNMAVLLVSTIGITNTLGRVICGWISSYESVDPIMVNNVSLTFGGLYTVILPLLPYSTFSYYLYASLFGLSMGKRQYRVCTRP